VKAHVFSFAVVAGLVGGALTVLTPADASAQAKPKVTRACGVSAIPLTVGNQWTYEGVGAPLERQLPQGAARLTPPQPKKLVIQVTSVESQGDVTTVTLSEDTDGRVINTTIVCGAANRIEIDPNSFFFAGEAGGSWNVNLSEVTHKGSTLNLAGGRLTGPEWRNDITAKWERVPTPNTGASLGKGALEMERRFVWGPTATLILPSGQYVGREITLEITGRVTLDPPAEKPLEMPANFRSLLWFADGTGLVQSVNGFGHMYILTSAKLTK
jgi:hypothetical protein